MEALVAQEDGSPRPSHDLGLPLSEERSTQPEELSLLQIRLSEYKFSALKYKKEGNLPVARSMLLVAKKIQEQIDRFQSGLGLSPGFLVPQFPEKSHLSLKNDDTSMPDTKRLQMSNSRLAVAPQSILASSYPAASTFHADCEPLSTASGSPPDSEIVFLHLCNMLKAQAEACTTAAAYHFRADQKPKALEFHKLKKKIVTELDSLSLLMGTPGSLPPTVSYQLVELETEVFNQDLKLTEMELSLGAIQGLELIVPDSSNVLMSYNLEGLTGATAECKVLKKADSTLGFF